MVIHVFTVNGQKLATGLYWQNLSDTAHPRKEIVRAGREAETDLVCVPAVKNPIQAGYVSKSELPTFKSGVRSLAGGLAECHPGSWLGLFKVPDDDQYYYIAIQNDHILASSDIVGPLDEIRTTFEQTLSVGGWQYVAVPEGFAYPGVTVNHLTLSEMLTKRAPKLKPLEFKFQDLPVKKIIYGLVATGVVGLMVFGYSTWVDEQEKKRLEEARRQLAQQELARQAALNKAMNMPPWTKSIAVERFLDTCAVQWRAVRYSVGGWEMSGWNCEGNQTLASYDKAPMASAIQLMREMPNAALAGDGRRAALITPMKMAATGARPADRGITAKARLMDYAESHDLIIAFQPVLPPQPLPGQEAPPPPPWQLETINIDSSYPVFGLLELADVPGLILKRLSVEISNDAWKWRIEGELYVSR